MKSSSAVGTPRPSMPRQRSTSCATACETSSDLLVSGLNMITRSGSHGRPQVGDGGLIVGAVDVGFGERRAEPAVMIDDDEASRAPVIIEGPSRIARRPG